MQYDLAYTECRSLGHEWRKGKTLGTQDEHDRFQRPFGDQTRMIGIPSTCTICGTEKIRWISRSGESFTRYAHPDGYSVHGDDVLTAKEWRHSYVTTLFADMAATNGKAKTRRKAAAA